MDRKLCIQPVEIIHTKSFKQKLTNEYESFFSLSDLTFVSETKAKTQFNWVRFLSIFQGWKRQTPEIFINEATEYETTKPN